MQEYELKASKKLAYDLSRKFKSKVIPNKRKFIKSRDRKANKIKSIKE